MGPTSGNRPDRTSLSGGVGAARQTRKFSQAQPPAAAGFPTEKAMRAFSVTFLASPRPLDPHFPAASKTYQVNATIRLFSLKL